MIENYNDLISLVVLIAIPLGSIIYILKNIITKRYYDIFEHDESNIEYYKEW